MDMNYISTAAYQVVGYMEVVRDWVCAAQTHAQLLLHGQFLNFTTLGGDSSMKRREKILKIHLPDDLIETRVDDPCLKQVTSLKPLRLSAVACVSLGRI